MPGYKGGPWRFEWLVEQVEDLIEQAGLQGEVEIDDDQYNNSIRLYYESTEELDRETGRWRVWDEDEERWLDDQIRDS